MDVWSQYKELPSILSPTGDRVYRCPRTTTNHKFDRLDVTPQRAANMAVESLAVSRKMNKFIIWCIFIESKRFSSKNVWIAAVVIMFNHLENRIIKIVNAKQKLIVNLCTMRGRARGAATHSLPTRRPQPDWFCSNALCFRGLRAWGHVTFAGPCYWQSFPGVIAIKVHIRTHSGEYLVCSENTR